MIVSMEKAGTQIARVSSAISSPGLLSLKLWNCISGSMGYRWEHLWLSWQVDRAAIHAATGSRRIVSERALRNDALS